MKQAVAELKELLSRDDASKWVSNLWDKYNQHRQPKLAQWAETEKYITATDTTTTSNQSLPWTHTSTLPKITQIRDNLHANYLSSLFPNDKWLSWISYDSASSYKEKADIVQGYMENKTREGGYRDMISRLLYDYIDYGNAFTQPYFQARYKETKTERVASFVGPKTERISPYDIVFNPTVKNFDDTFKIVRSWVSIGEVHKLVKENPNFVGWKQALERRELIRKASGQLRREDWHKAQQYEVDGFGSLQEYYGANTVEVLDFYGDYYNDETGVYEPHKWITVVDRCMVVQESDIPTYGGNSNIRHVGWRLRSDNLWAMGPLDNLIGLQYMLDHYMNMGANALDLKIMPPLKIIGEVENFIWGPRSEIHIDEEGDVQELAQQFGDIYTVRDWMEFIEMKMELYAGAPREAMGIRTPGEKTAFEVQSLENASSRIFQEKIIQFELFMEKNLNDMLELAHRNLDFTDTISVIDNNLNVKKFKEITKEHLSANGVLRPIGARHFAQKANELQNLVGVFNSPLGEIIRPHVSGVATTKFIEDVVDLRGYDMFRENVAVEEAQQTQTLSNQMQEDADMVGMTSEEELMLEGQSNEEPPLP